MNFVGLQSILWALLSLFFLSCFFGFQSSDQSHDIERRVYYTQNVAYTSYFYETVTKVYTPSPLPGDDRYEYISLTTEQMSSAPPCNDPYYRAEIRPNATSCETYVCIRPKALGNRNFKYFEIPDLPWIAWRYIPANQTYHWSILYWEWGAKYTYASNPYQPPPEFACFYYLGLPVGVKNYTIYIVDYYGEPCKATMAQPQALSRLNCVTP